MPYDTASTQEAGENPSVEPMLTFLHSLLRPDPTDPQVPERSGRGRPKKLTSDHLWLAMLVAVLRGCTSFAGVWRLLTWTGVGTFARLSITRAGVRKRLLQEPLGSLHDLLGRVSAALLPWTTRWQDESLAPFATQVLALDQSTLDAVRRCCQDVRQDAGNDPRLLVGKLAGLFDLRRQQWRRVLIRSDVFANEKHLVEELVLGLQPGTLLLADLGYFSFAWFDWLTDQGHWWLSRMREKTSYTLEHVFVQQDTVLDALVWLGAYRADCSKHLVRLMQFEHAGLCYRYLTNVRDPQLLSMSDAARLYARRWDIELAFKTLKRELGIHLWWSSHRVLVLQQLFCAFLLAQVLHALHLRVAGEAGVDLFEVSLPVLVKLLSQAPAQTGTESVLHRLVQQGRVQGLIRPSRRYQPCVPALLISYTPAPPDLVVIRNARYAKRKCQPRSDRSCFLPRFFSFFLI